jgi:hypothetical protein
MVFNLQKKEGFAGTQTKVSARTRDSKKYLHILLLFHFSFLIFNYSPAQDTAHLRISLLTCTPGEELYATFGHSAFRVTDSTGNSDIVYNYGTFNFDEDGFYLKFMRGKLLYYVNPENFSDFSYDYRAAKRGITEQVLNLTANEKISLQQFLLENIKDQNKYYKYDFFLDNCTTRLRDILKKQHDSVFCLKPVMPSGTRFRKAIHEYLDNNNQQWSELGIDILLGLPCDAKMTTQQMQFLPDNLMKSLDSSSNKIIASKQVLFAAEETRIKESYFSPLVVFSILLLVIILTGSIKNKYTPGFLQGFDGILFFITGLMGILLILMWTATDHAMCKNNFNLLWAWPTHFIASFFVHSKKKWVKKYFRFNSLLMVLVLAFWFFLPQQMNKGLIPIVLLLLYRSWARSNPLPDKPVV